MKLHRNSDAKTNNREPQQNYRLVTVSNELLGHFTSFTNTTSPSVYKFSSFAPLVSFIHLFMMRVFGFPNGTNGIPISFKVLPMVPLVITICTNGNANGTIGSPSGTIGTIGKPMIPLVSQRYHWLPMIPLVKLPMVPLGEPRTEPLYQSSGIN